MKKAFLLAVLAVNMALTSFADVVWYDGTAPVSYKLTGKFDPVVTVALQMFTSDMEQVTGKPAVASASGTIRLYQLDKAKGSDVRRLKALGVPTDSLAGRLDAFSIVAEGGNVFVVGSNGRGTAYGLLELSRMAGVSPWVWWGDVVPERRERLSLPESFTTLQAPSVDYRGIFINDEDWSLRNWAWKHYERLRVGDGTSGMQTSQFGTMGPKTYKAVFQLLLRLRANAIWPGMHTGTPGFFTIPGNKEMADSCGIVIGTSHCEPLLRNNVAEWDVSARGPYNYITNRDQVQQYWIERLQQVRGSEEFFTIGMRGIHDGSMEGVRTKEEKLNGLQQVIDDQRELLRRYYNNNVEQVPQVFIPYKEVLEIMESGLRVPDDVTLMWCDDNYGYMTRLSDEEQQRRSGGGGVYYHLSYWGRPHDYLWLTTTQPGLVYSEMKAAYDHNCRKLWIVNVHDPKVAAYDLELFLDMAWNINSLTPSPSPKGEGSGQTLTIEQHLERWLCTQFGQEAGHRLFPAMKEFYRLCGIRKPEFMGWTQVELADRRAYPRGRSHVIDTEFTNEFGGELERYLSNYNDICQTVEQTEALVRPELKDAFFAHVKYPVLAARAMAVKMLEAQRARSKYQGQTDRAMEGREDYMLTASARAIQAYREIQQLTHYYNDSLAGGKWKGIMNMMPRDLPVFNPPTVPYLPASDFLPGYGTYTVRTAQTNDAIARNACQYQTATEGVQTIQMLGHSMNAVSIPKDGEVVFEFTVGQEMQIPGNGEVALYTAMIPTQPNDRGDLRYQVTLDDQEPIVISLKEPYRSEFWKTSVLRGQALKKNTVNLGPGQHTLKVKALDDHIILDQWMIDFKPNRKFYVIPV
ncbi:MAG: glycosyl hydrolase 115 family protein [Prevotella sp.]|nr:glycosyl hydrolase 115 family protein [Prevotella sp.]